MIAFLVPAVAGFVAVLVGFTSSVALVFGAAQALGASATQIGSWLGALCLAMGLLTIGFSWYYRQPIMVAWSTPGAALLTTSLVGVLPSDAVGAFIFCGLLIFVAGASGLFDKLMNRLPLALANAILAGVLAKFALDAIRAGQSQLILVGGMFASYLLFRRLTPRYAVPLVLACGITIAALGGLMHWDQVSWTLTTPVWVSPTWSWQTLLSVGVPLFIVTMASQNLPGVATLRSHHYDAPTSPVIAGTGLASTILAPLGCFAVNLAAITAALVMTPAAHPDPNKRYQAAIACGAIYVALALFAGSLATFLSAFPKVLILSIAGIALLGTIGNGLAQALQHEGTREAALVTFLVTLSGVAFVGIGSAFWAVVVGAVVYWVFKPRDPAIK